MTWAISCADCDELVWPPADAEGPGGQSEIAALRIALSHTTSTGHASVEVVPGCYYTGIPPRPESFGDGVSPDADECITPERGKMATDLSFAVNTLRNEADRIERWADSKGHTEERTPRQTFEAARTVPDHLRERADLIERKQREREQDDDTVGANR